MSKVDDELTRRLQRAERPVDSDDLFEGLERRREHRERLRRVQAGLVAFAVLASTAGGFAILREAFDTDESDVGATPSPGVLGPNGEIVFVKEGDDARMHIFAAQPDGSGERQLTEGSTNDSDPAVSPDGRTVAFARVLDGGMQRIATVRIDGGEVTNVAEDSHHATDPAWSPDGASLAFVTTGIDSRQLATIDIEQGQTRYLLDFFGQLADPTWSPDGTQIALGVVLPGSPGSVGIVPTNTMAERPLEGTLGDGSAPAWSPDGSKIALIRSGNEGDEIWTMAPDGTSETLIATRVEGSLQSDLAWAPDGTALLVSDGTWIYRVEAAPAGDPRDNFVRLMQGQAPSWQPLPADSDPSPTASPEPSVEPEPNGRDIGLGFPVCQVTELAAQFDGEGPTDTAFVATRLGDDTRCPSDIQQAAAYVGIDIDQDGLVDGSFGPIACEVYYCRAFAAPDLDGDDGKRELLVVESDGSIVGLGIYALATEAGSLGNTEVVRIHIGESDLVQNGFVTGEPARLFIGGDEGWSYRLRCEDHGVNRFIYQQRAFRAVDSNGPSTVDETTLVYYHGRLELFDARDPELSTSDDPLGPQPAEVCGAPIPPI